ncbi:unnamed protein product [Microthlaspi erraticum]|uniref:Uncharacterized protein n=1 Tax=Microthlaspi erraticum TaxID=1685480 RepID=A0A6D2IAE9_9BRAS|nr:unnamed protein product [Microthlaspi erraticum]
MITFSNRTVQIEESEDSVRLRSACVLGCFAFEFLQNLRNLFIRPTLPDSDVSKENHVRDGAVIDLGGDGKFTPHAEMTRDEEALYIFRQDYKIPNEIELVLPAEGEDPEHVRPRFCCAYTVYFQNAGMIFPVTRFLLEALAHPRVCGSSPGRERVNWNMFTPERIRRVLSSPPTPPPGHMTFGAEVVAIPSTVQVSSDQSRSTGQGQSKKASKRARSNDGDCCPREIGDCLEREWRLRGVTAVLLEVRTPQRLPDLG